MKMSPNTHTLLYKWDNKFFSIIKITTYLNIAQQLNNLIILEIKLTCVTPYKGDFISIRNF